MDKIKKFIKKNELLSPDDVVLVGFSGGSDSHFLLDVLSKLGYSVCACHLNHQLRGEESERDLAFAKAVCKEKGIPFYSEKIDIKKISEKENKSIELCAREQRYLFYFRAQKKLGATKIATGHNAQDNLETILLNLARGTGLGGLCGIPPMRETVIRPILSVTPEEIATYLMEHGLTYVSDSSNESDDYRRNQLRHHVVPYLCGINPQILENVTDMSEMLRADNAILNRLAEESGIDIDVMTFRKLSRSIGVRILAQKSPKPLTKKQIYDIIAIISSKNPSATLDIGDDLIFYREYNNFGFAEKKPAQPIQKTYLKFGKNVSDYYTIFVSERKLGEFDFVLDRDKVVGKLFIRARAVGDKLKLAGRYRKSIKNLFIDMKIPKAKREEIPVLCDDLGPIAIFGIGVDERASLNIENPIYIKFERKDKSDESN